FIYYLICLAISMGCTQKEQGFTITTNLQGFEENAKVTITENATQKVLDSTTITNGNFTAKGILESPPASVSVTIFSKDGKNRSFTSFFIGNEPITLTGKKTNFYKNAVVTGSAYNGLRVAYTKLLDPLYEKRDQKLNKMFALRNQGKWNDSLQDAYWSKTGLIPKIDKEISQLSKKFIAENINSHFGLRELVSTKTEYSEEFIRSMLAKLNNQFKTSKYVSVLETYLENDALKIGDAFYDFQGENRNGETLSFGSFFQNTKKYTLLEFSTPNCGWCRKAMPEIKKLALEADNALQVVTFYVDKNKEDWQKLVTDNSISWPTLWSAEGRYSKTYTKYRVLSTPTYYLFDAQGKLQNKWIGYDQNLSTNIKNALP
ncbi:MAG: AhpC/TSA family protein, partial [Flavobacteriaceae bacterium]|nr:AhpC/TSA family protein [Flavobacteriaceae bacterium]